jgi:hypothetical protein
MSDLRYPLGPFAWSGALAGPDRQRAVDDIAALPAALRVAVAGLDDGQLDTSYRDGGWTVRQVVHHVADSHVNAYVRMRLALAEDAPAIRPYDENAWAALPDGRALSPAVSLALVAALHARWVVMLRGVGAAEGARTVFHPEHGRTMTLDELIAQYAWHGRHHVAHVAALRQRRGW